ncbi:MAG: hypothetical protein ABII63_05170 [Pseudomonadota bacterium]
MSKTNPIVKGLKQYASTPDLQQNKSTKCGSNVLLFNRKKGFATGVCNTSSVDTDKKLHTAHAEVGLLASDKPQHILDIENMSEAALKKEYPKEYNSWRSRRDCAKQESLPWSPEFDKFSGFLRVVGLKPKPNYQLDKIIKEYGYVPDNVRWVSPTENSQNKKATRLLTHNDETHSVSVWAKKFNIPKSTIFSRLRSGWSVSAAITGTPPQGKTTHSIKPAKCPWPQDVHEIWEKSYQQECTSAPRLYYYLVKSLSKLTGLKVAASEWAELNINPNEDETDEQISYMKKQSDLINKWEWFYQDALQKSSQRIPALNQMKGEGDFLMTIYRNANFIQAKLE